MEILPDHPASSSAQLQTAASNLNMRNGESQNSHSVSTSSHHTATQKNREIGNLERPAAAVLDARHRLIWRATSRSNAACGSIEERINFRWEPLRSRTPKGANAHRRTRRIFDGNLCARGRQWGPTHIVERNMERARCQLECQAIGVPRAGRKRPVISKAL